MDYVSGCGGELTSRLTLQAYSSDIIVIHHDAWPRRSATPNPPYPRFFFLWDFGNSWGWRGRVPPWLRYWQAGAKKNFRGEHGERRTRDAEGVEGLLCKLTVTVKAK